MIRDHIPLGVGFYPDWFNKHYDISFGKEYYFDPENRIEARMIIGAELKSATVSEMDFSTTAKSFVERLTSSPMSHLPKKARDWFCRLANSSRRRSVATRDPTQRMQ